MTKSFILQVFSIQQDHHQADIDLMVCLWYLQHSENQKINNLSPNTETSLAMQVKNVPTKNHNRLMEKYVLILNKPRRNNEAPHTSILTKLL